MVCLQNTVAFLGLILVFVVPEQMDKMKKKVKLHTVTLVTARDIAVIFLMKFKHLGRF